MENPSELVGRIMIAFALYVLIAASATARPADGISAMSVEQHDARASPSSEALAANGRDQGQNTKVKIDVILLYEGSEGEKWMQKILKKLPRRPRRRQKQKASKDQGSLDRPILRAG